jgi:methylphosphotriester-DNA--protein-cysteine methyltransferase
MKLAAAPMPRQSYRERRPRADLAELVSCVWIQRVSGEGPAYEHRTVPNGCIEIACGLESGVVRVIGTRRGPLVERLDPGATVVGLRFRPGAAPPILGWPAAELVDVELELHQLWPRTAARLGASMAEAASAAGAAQLLEREIAARRADGERPDPVVAEAVRRLQPWRSSALEHATTELFLSPRQLRRHFAAAVGYGPKTLHRILRFQGFLALLQASDPGTTTLPGLAVVAGYADQAHLTRECGRLTGLTPRVFVDEMRRSCGSTHDHAASFAPLRLALHARVRG